MGVWNKPPGNGRELMAEDVQFTFDRSLAEKGDPLAYLLEPVDRLEGVDRYTVPPETCLPSGVHTSDLN